MRCASSLPARMISLAEVSALARTLPTDSCATRRSVRPLVWTNVSASKAPSPPATSPTRTNSVMVSVTSFYAVLNVPRGKGRQQQTCRRPSFSKSLRVKSLPRGPLQGLARDPRRVAPAHQRPRHLLPLSRLIWVSQQQLAGKLGCPVDLFLDADLAHELVDQGTINAFLAEL